MCFSISEEYNTALGINYFVLNENIKADLRTRGINTEVVTTTYLHYTVRQMQIPKSVPSQATVTSVVKILSSSSKPLSKRLDCVLAKVIHLQPILKPQKSEKHCSGISYCVHDVEIWFQPEACVQMPK